MANYWVATIADVSTGQIILDSLPLVTGQYPAANLLGQYAYLGLGSAVVLNMENSPLDYPDSETLGTIFLLAWGDTVQ